jgi:hypothetical protein
MALCRHCAVLAKVYWWTMFDRWRPGIWLSGFRGHGIYLGSFHLAVGVPVMRSRIQYHVISTYRWGTPSRRSKQ